MIEVGDSHSGSRYESRYVENSVLLSALEGSGVQMPYLLSASELDDMRAIRDKYVLPDNTYAKELVNVSLFDLDGRTSVAEYARKNELDWFSGKTAAQLDAMEKTAFVFSDGQMIFYEAYLGMHF